MHREILDKLREYEVHKPKYIKEINSINLNRLAIAFGMLFVLEFFAIIGRMIGYDTNLNPTLIAVLVVKLVITGGYPIIYSVSKSFWSEKVRFDWVSYGFVVLLGAIQIYLLYDEIISNHTIYNLLIYLFLLTSVIIYPPGHILPLYGLVSISGYAILLSFGNAAAISNSVLAFIVFTITCPVISYLVFSNHFEGFVNKQKLDHFAMVDPLTLIYNRRGFYRKLEELMESYKNGDLVSAIMMDIDSFKVFNDNYGHDAGDRCLQAIARSFFTLLQKENEVYSRFGGEEFVIALYGHNKEEAIEIAEGLRRQVEEMGIPHTYGKKGSVVTVSLGIAWRTIDESFNMDELIQAADICMYQAKAAGGNVVEYQK